MLTDRRVLEPSGFATSARTDCRSRAARGEVSKWSPASRRRRSSSTERSSSDAQLVLVHHGLFWDFHPTGCPPSWPAAAAAVHARYRPGRLPPPARRAPRGGQQRDPGDMLGCERTRRSATSANAAPRSGAPARSPATECRRGPLHARARRDPARAARPGRGAGAGAPHRDRVGLRRRRARRGGGRSGLDAFLTGKPREHVMADARELAIHFIAAGHYATETFGVRALGDSSPTVSGSSTSSWTSRIPSKRIV